MDRTSPGIHGLCPGKLFHSIITFRSKPSSCCLKSCLSRTLKHAGRVLSCFAFIIMSSSIPPILFIPVSSSIVNVQKPILIDNTKLLLPYSVGKGGVWQCTNVTVHRWSSFNAPTPRLVFWRGKCGIFTMIHVPKFAFPIVPFH